MAAGFFLFLGLIFAFHSLAWGLNDFFDEPWARLPDRDRPALPARRVAGFIAYRSVQAGAPPTPDMAIEEAKRTREVLEHPEVQQDAHAVAPQEIRASIERNRRELVGSVEDLRVKVKS